MMRAPSSSPKKRFGFAAVIFAGALLMLFGSAAATQARADDLAINNSVLLNPFDPVPEIRFSRYGCDDECGDHRCYRGCGEYRRCWHECDSDRDHCWRDCRSGRRCERDCGPTTGELNHEWLKRAERYDNQADDWHDDMHEWHAAMGAYEDEWRTDHDGHWHYWHDHHWHDDCDGGHCHDGHGDHDSHDGDHHGADHQDGDHHDADHHDDGPHKDGDHKDGDHHDDGHQDGGHL